MRTYNNYINIMFDLYEEVEQGTVHDTLQPYKRTLPANDYKAILILAGYVSTLLDLSIALDLTYQSLAHLSDALNALYLHQSKRYLTKKNQELTIKTAAAYITLLLINMHDTRLTTQLTEDTPRWAGLLRIATGTLDKTDFLPVMADCLTFEDSVALDPKPLINAYKEAAGVDLTTYISN